MHLPHLFEMFSKKKKKLTKTKLNTNFGDQIFRTSGFIVIFIIDLAINANFFTSLGEGWVMPVAGIALVFMKIWHWIEAQKAINPILRTIHYISWALIVSLSLWAAMNYGLSNTQLKSEKNVESTQITEKANKIKEDEQALQTAVDNARKNAEIASINSWLQEKTNILSNISSNSKLIISKQESLDTFKKEFPEYYTAQRQRQTEIDKINATIELDRKRSGELDKLINDATASKTVEIAQPEVVSVKITEEDVASELNAEIIFRQTLGEYFQVGIVIFFLIFGMSIELTLATSSINPEIETDDQKKRRISKKEKIDAQKLYMKEEKEKLSWERYLIKEKLKLEKFRIEMEIKRKELAGKTTSSDEISINTTSTIKDKQEAETKREKKTVISKKTLEVMDSSMKNINLSEEADLKQFEEPIVEVPIVEPVEDLIVEPVVEPIVEQVKETIAEPIVEPIIEPVVEPVEELVVELVVEPIVEPIVEPVIEPVEEPIVEQVVEPVIEPIVEPVVEPVKETIVEQIVEPVEEELIIDKKEDTAKKIAQLMGIIDVMFKKVDDGKSFLLSEAELSESCNISIDRSNKIYKYLNYIDVIYFDKSSSLWKPKKTKSIMIDIVNSKLTKAS